MRPASSISAARRLRAAICPAAQASRRRKLGASRAGQHHEERHADEAAVVARDQEPAQMEEEMVRIDDGEGAGSLTTLLSPLLYEQKERSKRWDTR